MYFSAILILFLKTFSVQKRKTNTKQIFFECKTTFVNFNSDIVWLRHCPTWTLSELPLPQETMKQFWPAHKAIPRLVSHTQCDIIQVPAEASTFYHFHNFLKSSDGYFSDDFFSWLGTEKSRFLSKTRKYYWLLEFDPHCWLWSNLTTKHMRSSDASESLSFEHLFWMLCAVQVLGEPFLTLATTCGTAVSCSLGSARLLQQRNSSVCFKHWFCPCQNCQSSPAKLSILGCCVCGFHTAAQGAGPLRSFSFVQLRWSGFIRYSAPCLKAGLLLWEEPTLLHNMNVAQLQAISHRLSTQDFLSSWRALQMK